jgi:DNA-binding transcriptional MerR regulator
MLVAAHPEHRVVEFVEPVLVVPRPAHKLELVSRFGWRPLLTVITVTVISAHVSRISRSASLARRTEKAARKAASEARPAYTVDELAFATGVPSRTIRFYQFKGVLPRPARRGRVALYDDRHIERLRLVGELQDRGLSLRAVRHLLREDSQDARLLSGCLGVGESLEKPWSDDRPRTVGQDELEEVVGRRPPGTIASLIDFGVIERTQTGPAPSYRIASPGLLKVTLALQASGVDIETAVCAGDILRRCLRTAARELVDHFSRRAGRGFGRSSAPGEISAALDALRPLAGEAARLIFARQIEHALRKRSRSNGPRVSPRRRRRRDRAR